MQNLDRSKEPELFPRPKSKKAMLRDIFTKKSRGEKLEDAEIPLFREHQKSVVENIDNILDSDGAGALVDKLAEKKKIADKLNQKT